MLGGSFANSKWYTGAQWQWISYGGVPGVGWKNNDEDQCFTYRLLFSEHKAMVEAY